MPKILVIDSEPGMRQIIDKILAPQGYELFAAEDGAQAVANCPKIDPDLALLDVRLPDVDSADILESLRKIKPSLPVVILSGFGDVETALELVKKGAFGYIPKPFKVDALRQIVKKAQNHQVAAVIETRVEEIPPESALPEAARPVRKTGSKKTFLFIAGGALLLSVAGFVVWNFRFRKLPAKEFSIPHANAAAISYDGKHLWIANWVDETIYKHRRDAGFSVVATYKTQGLEPSGLAFDGKYLWVSSSFSQKISRRNLDAVLSPGGVYASTGTSVAGLYYDGANLWSMDFQQGRIYKHALDGTLSVVATYDSPAVNPCGMFKYGKDFFIADSSTNRIYRVDARDFSLRGIYALAPYAKSKNHITGMAWDGRSIWTCQDGVQKVLRCPMQDLVPVKM